MPAELGLFLIAGLAAVVVDLGIIVLGIVAFQNPEETIFRRKGTLAGWIQCSAIVGVVILATLIPFGIIIGTVVWWILAIRVLKLTIRQTLQINIFTFICHVVLVVAVVGTFAS